MPSPNIVVSIGANGAAYGVYLLGQPIDTWASITAFPTLPFTLVSEDMRDNLDIVITGVHGRRIAPNTPVPASQASDTSYRAYGGVRLSDLGYDLGPGRYRITVALKPRIANFAKAQGYTVETKVSELRIVRQYSDVDAHFFPAPSGWATDGCAPWYIDGRRTFQELLRSKQTALGEECFHVYLFPRAMRDGFALEHDRANGNDMEPLSQTVVTCGSDRATIFTYRSKTVPQTHYEAVLLRVRDEDIVARYSRPDGAVDDPAALEALNAPCRLL